MVEITLEVIIVVAAWLLSPIIAIVIALFITAPAAEKRVVARMTDPNGPVQALRDKEREQLVGDLKKMIGDQNDMKQRVESALVDLQTRVANIKIPEMPKEISVDTAAFGPIIQTEVQAALKSAWGKRLTASAVEDAGGALENTAEAIALAQKDPGNAERLAGFIKAVEQGETLGLIKPAQAKKAVEQARQLWRSGQDLLPLAQRFGISVEGGGGGSATGTRGGPI